jgi:hypothetical protein
VLVAETQLDVQCIWRIDAVAFGGSDDSLGESIGFLEFTASINLDTSRVQ